MFTSRTRMVLGSLCLTLAYLPAIAQGLAAGAPAKAKIPYVACRSADEMGEASPSTSSSTIDLDLPPEAASQLAFYKPVLGQGVLAPRGWNCLQVYTLNGSTLYISPATFSRKQFFQSDWQGFSGPVVQFSMQSGGAYTRFGVARIIALAFPRRRSFLQQIAIEEFQHEPYPSGSYPTDKLKYVSDDVVEFETPSLTEGLGTEAHLLKDSDPITGVAILNPRETYLTYLSMKLPQDLKPLSPYIVQNVETTPRGQQQESSNQAASGR